MNYLYYGENLDVLRRYIKDETVDLVYLDPPSKSDQDYKVLFAESNYSACCTRVRESSRAVKACYTEGDRGAL
jgi:site-specific DNA-methyltransferase (adenine-specific)